MKLLLIREVSEIRGDLSHGLGIIGTIAKDEADVSIFDNNSFHKTYTGKEIINRIKEFNPDILGFHVHTHNFFATSKLISQVKKAFPSLCLIAGGLHAFHEPKEILDLGVHVVAVEEADLTILPMLRALKPNIGQKGKYTLSEETQTALAAINGLLFYNPTNKELQDTGRPELIKNLDDLPFVDHSLFNLEDYIKKPSDTHYVTNTLLTQRGCPFKCSFCQGDEDGAFRMTRENSADYRIRYIEYLIEKFDQKHFYFFDANFTLSRKRTLEFCQKMIDTGLNKKITYWCETNVVLKLDKELCSMLKESGCIDIALGVERLNEESLKLIGKNKNFSIINDNINNLKESGIRATANALIGFPFDTKKSVEEEEALFKGIINKVDSIMVSVVLPLPGTQIYNESNNKKWYFDKEYASWEPPFYHYAYNFNGNAWTANYFDLSPDTMDAIRGMRERMHAASIHQINSRIVSTLFIMVEGLAKTSLFLFNKSPLLERIVFGPVKWGYLFLWKFMVSKFYVSR
ncbi:MAG: radical SAM protein [Magnetococcales bacterium]|nr:radical SAM protein [Magnetococcales bacterium]